MDKIWVLLFCVNFAWCQSHEENSQGTCDDCVPITMCKEAAPYLDPTVTNLQYINKFFCSITNHVINVCCSKLKDSLIGERHPNLKLLPDNCGNIYNAVTARIVGGVEAEVFEFPWVVLISYRPNLEFKCSGTLINSRYVLTAAHCVHNADIAGVRVGEHKIGEDIDCKEGVCTKSYQDLRASYQIIHENYNKFDNYANDIALIRLEENVDMSLTNADTICLPITEELQSRPITSQFATVVGWGTTEYNQVSSVLLKVLVNIRANKHCQTYYSDISPSDKKRFCAGGKMSDSCKGDSGGPLMLTDSYKGKIKMIQYGIVSYGGVKCGTHIPGVYTNVRNYVNWILDNISE